MPINFSSLALLGEDVTRYGQVDGHGYIDSPHYINSEHISEITHLKFQPNLFSRFDMVAFLDVFHKFTYKNGTVFKKLKSLFC